jgi:hypothetical protein
MKNPMVSLIVFVVLAGFSMNASAQRGYNEFDRREGIYIQEYWQRANVFDRYSNAALSLRMTNETENTVEVVFTVTFFRNDQLMFESKDNKICLRPGQSLRGANAGLRFMAEGISMDMIREDWFSWDITALEVTPVESCR